MAAEATGAADDSGAGQGRRIAPEDAPEHDPGTEAGLPQR